LQPFRCVPLQMQTFHQNLVHFFQPARPWVRYGPRAPPTTLPDKIWFKHWRPLNVKSIGNIRNIGLRYPFGSNVGLNAEYLQKI